MKNSKQNAKEIMEKIEKREIARLRIRKRVRHVCAVAIVLGFLLPATVYFSMNEEMHRYRPLSHPFQKDETPFDPDENPSDIPEIRRSEKNELALFM